MLPWRFQWQLAGEWILPPPKPTLTPLLLNQLIKIQATEEYLKRKAKAPVTTETYIKALKELTTRTAEINGKTTPVNLDNPVTVETAIANYTKRNPITKELTDTPVSNVWKNQCIDAYKQYCEAHEINWKNPPHYKVDEHSKQPPTDEKCAMLLATARSELSLKIDISTQTGLRPVEIVGTYKGLRAKDIHADTKTITPTSAKGCNPRPPITITIELATKLQTFIIRKNLKPNDVIFNEDAESYGNSFRNMRNRLADKLKDPSIKTIKLYHLRDYYITKILRKIQNVEIVRQKVGHKRLNTTQKYMHLLADQSGEWIVESTTDQKRADELLRQDFTYILTTPDGYMKFRKPK